MSSDRRLVVGAVLVDDAKTPTRVLAARRTNPPALAGRWEFPGGKVEIDETPEVALRRELLEELKIEIAVDRELQTTTGEAWPISDQHELRLFYATIESGQVVVGDSHDAVRWLASTELDSVEWLDSDLQAIPSVFRSG